MKSKKQIISNSQGQIIVEYMLLLVIAVTCATLLIKGLVGRGEEPGIIIKNWSKMMKVIGNDLPDCSTQTNFSDNPKCNK